MADRHLSLVVPDQGARGARRAGAAVAPAWRSQSAAVRNHAAAAQRRHRPRRIGAYRGQSTFWIGGRAENPVAGAWPHVFADRCPPAGLADGGTGANALEETRPLPGERSLPLFRTSKLVYLINAGLDVPPPGGGL